ncbi:calcium:proton antiporter [Lichenihabitans sp. PAMC28606]|uniref:calcium:proton antiporter n=1 Tax=Lichenihabitans sp. PAMC28606 TaxID=2880932 RepID=UPI001D0A23A5|nr:calcium:proton antiporter [Lichenihabitans sp. PAMC28606]UDL94277.1 calcium:proton antiporter [Lichenihabitans sp. PAMC28606]
MKTAVVVRLAIAWITVGVAFVFGDAIYAASASLIGSCMVFAALLAIIMWSAFGVVEEADHLADRLGEPYGTLLLTLSIVLIEVALIGAVMLGSADPTLGRDTMFAVLMIVLNGVVGLGLLVGGWRYGAQVYNLEGASAYLAVIMPLTVIALVLPNFTVSTSAGTLSTEQAISLMVFTVLLYGTFLALQTGRHQDFFTMPEGVPHGDLEPAPSDYAGGSSILPRMVLLILSLLPVVLLAKRLAKVLDRTIETLHAPTALGGVIIAIIVFTPEGLAALRAVSLNRLQRTINLCLGAAASTIGLTVPAVLVLGLLTGQNIVLGLSPSNMVLLALTLILSTLTFSGPRTTALNGAMHLVVFFVYITLIFSP